MRKALFLLLISLALLTGLGATLSWYGVLTYDSVLEVLTISKNTNHTGTLTVGGESVLLSADSYTICTVAEIPADPDSDSVYIITDGDGPCDTAMGGGTYVSLHYYDGSTWYCVSGEEATTQTQILADDTEITITDDGVSAGSIAVEVDGTAVATFTEAGTSLGPIAATATLTADNTYSSTQLLTGANGGETISQWQTVKYDGTAGEYLLADANAAGKWPADGIAVAASTNGNPIQVMVAGFARNDTDWNWNPGDPICLSETPGGIVICSDASICSADGDCYHKIGTAITADIVYFDFTKGWGECNGS